MTENQIKAAHRIKAALLAQSKEKARDLFYLRQAGTKGVIVAWTPSRLPAAFLFRVLLVNAYLATSFDFQIVGSNIPGISQIIPQNEEAYSYLLEETLYTVFDDGTTALFDERCGDFISDASYAHLCCEYAWGVTASSRLPAAFTFNVL